MNIKHPRGLEYAVSVENHLLLNVFTSVFSKLACTLKKNVQMRHLKTSELTKLPMGIAQKG